jgi:hypothetical protein
MDDPEDFDFVGQDSVKDQVGFKPGNRTNANAVEKAILETTNAANFGRALQQSGRGVESVQKMNRRVDASSLQKLRLFGEVAFGHAS